MTLYETLTEKGVQVSNWQSDLYFPVNEETREIVKQFPGKTYSVFRSNIDGQMMFEAPFMFDPFWQKRGMH